jgi:hypothetical protein
LAASAATIGAAWGLAVLLFDDPTVRRALMFAAPIAFIVQLIAFLIASVMARRKNVIAGWGIGIILRFAALFLFALVAVPRLDLPVSASLLALAAFLFLSTLIEPLFLTQ